MPRFNQFILLKLLPIIFGVANAQLTAEESRFVGVDSKVQKLLSQRIHLDLRDVTLLEAIFAIRDQAKLNVVVGDDIQGTVNAAFADTEVHQVLDSLLIPRGYSYRVVGGSLIILPVANVGERLPNFGSATIHLQTNATTDILPIVTSMLSPEGRAHALTAAKTILVMDYTDRIQEIQRQVESLEMAATGTQLPNSGSGISGQVSEALPAQLVSVQNDVRVYHPQFVPVTNLLESLRPLLSKSGQITALESEDKLMVSDLPQSLEVIERAMQQLDQPRRQVRIWARIYDCSLEDVKACGINLETGLNGTALAAAGGAAQAVVLDTVTSPVAAPTNGVMSMTTINRLGRFESVIQALESGKDTRLLADPNIIVMNHEEAKIEIVTEVPFQQLTQGGIVGSFGTTNFREAGVKMLVTPHIAEDETISLVVNPTFSVLTGFTEGEQAAPIIDRREAKTTVRVANLQTLVLGGLRQRTRTAEQNGIPGLKNIPYVGKLFRWERQTARESELLVFITPELVCYDYSGTQREHCIGETLSQELEQTPTFPVPFGKHQLRAEQQARDRAINNKCKMKKCAVTGEPNCSCHLEVGEGIIGGYGCEEN